jgi:hypothetical protein
MATKTSFGTSTPSPPPTIIPYHPDGAELISTHLCPHIRSGSNRLRDQFIHNHDGLAVYSANPADLTGRFLAAQSKSSGEQAWYFYTKLQDKDGRGVNRKVHGGSGTWHSDAGFEPVVSPISGELIGYMKRFTFREKQWYGRSSKQGSGSRGVRTVWRMQELRVHSPGHGRGHRHGQVVLCKVYRSRRAPSSSNGGKPPPPPQPPVEEGWAGIEIVWGAKGKRRRRNLSQPPVEEGCAEIVWGAKGERGRLQQLKGGGEDDDGDGRRKEGMNSCPRCNADLTHPRTGSALLFPKVEPRERQLLPGSGAVPR